MKIYKIYNLYLDESGDFKDDLKNKTAPECIVGGYLMEQKTTEEEFENIAKSIIVDSWRRYMPEWKSLSKGIIFHRVNHATDVKKEFVIYPHVLQSVFESLKSKDGRFCILGNKNRAKIKDSNKTYLSILSGGIVFVLQRLCTENKNNENFCLNVVIGKRKDTEQNDKNIPEEDYSRIEEAIAKAKTNNPTIKDRQVEIKFKNDKDYPPLVISDYICNYYFTKALADKADVKHEKVNKVFDSTNNIIYQLGDELIFDEMNSYRRNLDFPTVLKGLCYDKVNALIWNENFEWLKQEFYKNPSNLISAFFDFDADLRRIETTERNYEKADQLIKKARNIIDKLVSSKDPQNEDQKYALNVCICSLWLHRATIYSHQGNQQKQNEYYLKVEKLLPEIREGKEKSNLYNIYAIRFILFKNYSYDILGAYEKCVELEKELQPHAPYVDEDLGKLYGSWLQVSISGYNNGIITYEEARTVSEKAIAIFKFDSDKRRQYQYRADLEASHGNIEVALEWLKKGFNKDSCDKISEDDKKFYYYHLSYIGVSAVRYGFNVLAAQIYKECEPWLKAPCNGLPSKEDSYKDFKIMPLGFALFNIELIKNRLNLGGSTSITKKVAEIAEIQKITFAPQLYAEIALCKGNSGIDKSFVCSKLDSWSHNNDFIEKTREFYAGWHDTLLNGNDKDLESFAKTRLY